LRNRFKDNKKKNNVGEEEGEGEEKMRK